MRLMGLANRDRRRVRWTFTAFAAFFVAFALVMALLLAMRAAKAL
jgi:hypothetical protein